MASEPTSALECKKLFQLLLAGFIGRLDTLAVSHKLSTIARLRSGWYPLPANLRINLAARWVFFMIDCVGRGRDMRRQIVLQLIN